MANTQPDRYTAGVAKRYDQYCPIAHALSSIGERWSLLVVRELIEGPKRYTDLSAGLPGIWTNILASRLRDLEAEGIVQKRKLPPPAACDGLRAHGIRRELEEVVYAIARWGARTLGPPGPADDLEPDWGLNAFPALFNPVAAAGMSGQYVLRIGDGVFTVSLVDGRVGVEIGVGDDPDFDATFDMETMFGLVVRRPHAGRGRRAGARGARRRRRDVRALLRGVQLRAAARGAHGRAASTTSAN